MRSSESTPLDSRTPSLKACNSSLTAWSVPGCSSPRSPAPVCTLLELVISFGDPCSTRSIRRNRQQPPYFRRFATLPSELPVAFIFPGTIDQAQDCCLSPTQRTAVAFTNLYGWSFQLAWEQASHRFWFRRPLEVVLLSKGVVVPTWWLR